MKRTYMALLAAMLVSLPAGAQQYRTAYFMEGSTLRGYLNPSFRPDRGYINIPAVGSLSVNFNSNALAINNIFYPVGTNGALVTLLDNRVAWNQIEGSLKQNNTVGIDLHTALLGTGFYTGRDFWSLEVGLDITGGFGIPKSFVEFLKLGSQSNTYDIGGLMAGAEATMNISAGWSRRITDELTVGARINFKGGLARMNMNYEKLNVTLNGEQWAIDAAGRISVSADNISIPLDSQGYVDTPNLDAASILSNIRGFSGFGMTFDLGAEYIFLDRFKFSAAILNIGFMNWNAADTFTGVSEASYMFDGMSCYLDPNSGQWVTEGVQGDFNFEEFAKFRQADGKARTKTYPGFVLGAEYDILDDNLLGAGILFTHRRNEFARRTELSLALTARPAEWFTASVSWVLGNYKNIGDNFFNSFGFALNFHPSWINFFVGTDFLMFRFADGINIPVGQKIFNINLGLSIPIGRSHCRGDYD